MSAPGSLGGGLRSSPPLRHALALARLTRGSLRDLAPIVLVIALFQLAVLQQPFPELARTLVGLVFVVAGLTLFVRGLEMGLFPVGEALAESLARRGSLAWMLVFAFALGFATTIAEPALIAVSGEAAKVAAESGAIAADAGALARFATALCITVAVSVGAALVLGVVRIVRGWPIHHFMIAGYILVVLVTPLAPEAIIGIAYDAGGVTTSTITVPLVTALGVGLAQMIKGRDPLVDGFGMIAFASLTPIVFVLLFGIVWFEGGAALAPAAVVDP